MNFFFIVTAYDFDFDFNCSTLPTPKYPLHISALGPNYVVFLSL
jgi:hypothetical protein